MSTHRLSHPAHLHCLIIDINTLPRQPTFSGCHAIRATDFLSAIHSATGIDLLSLYSQHVTEQQAEAQVEGMREGGEDKPTFSGHVLVDEGGLCPQRLSLEDLYQSFKARVRMEEAEANLGKVSIEDEVTKFKVEQAKRDLGKVSINIMGSGNGVIRP